ncbi:MAG: L-histidine N(alpha)-methyltransferase [Acidobacteriota bacterium]|nr:L-histidine N(alpha)-methyltransferase [Acidobacteriota bacterium]
MMAPVLEIVENTEFARDVAAGLGREGQKELPSKYLYDDLGSALFDAITLLPEYGLTRADARLLERHGAEVIRHFTRNPLVVELGSGSGSKTHGMLEKASHRGPVQYFPIDISGAALEKCRMGLQTISNVDVTPLTDFYLNGLHAAVKGRTAGQKILVLFLGSTIGNFYLEAAESFLRQMRNALLPGDALLLGTDLLKPIERMLAAYDDPVGVTAAFNRNVLSRINRELGGDFVIPGFEHEARFNPRHSRIEMHLRCSVPQAVYIESIDLRIEMREGETIWTEASQKFRPEEVRAMAHRAGFECRLQWIDGEWPFAENLLIASA